MVLTASFVLVMVQFVNGTSALSANGSGSSGAEQTSVVLSSMFADDFGSAQPCDPQRRGSLFYLAGPKEIAIYRDVENDGKIEIVTWKIGGVGDTQLIREVAAASPNCTPAAGTSASVVVASNISSSTVNFFAPRVKGGNVALTDKIVCVLTPTLCNWQAMGVRAVLREGAQGQGLPIVYEEVFDLNWKILRIPLSTVVSVKTDGGVDSYIQSTPFATDITKAGIEITAHVKADTWSNAGTFFSTNSDTKNGYSFGISTGGRLTYTYSADGSSTSRATATDPVPFMNGTAGHVRMVFDPSVNDGGSSQQVYFYSSTNGVNWDSRGSSAVPLRTLPYNPGEGARVGEGFTGTIYRVTGKGTTNLAANGWFNDNTDGIGFADHWTGYSETSGVDVIGAVSDGGSEGTLSQTASWNGSGQFNGMALAYGSDSPSCATPASENNNFCLMPNTDYTLRFYARGSGDSIDKVVSAGPGATQINGNVMIEKNPPLNGYGWSQYEYRFTTAAVTNSNIFITVDGSSTAGALSVSRVTLDASQSAEGDTLPPSGPPASSAINLNGDTRVFTGGRTLFGFSATDLSPEGVGSRGDSEIWKANADVELGYG